MKIIQKKIKNCLNIAQPKMRIKNSLENRKFFKLSSIQDKNKKFFGFNLTKNKNRMFSRSNLT